MTAGIKYNITEFFRHEYGRMVGFVRNLIADAADRDGEDIVQDVMMRIFETADISRPIEDLAAYVYRSLRNNVIDTFRRRRDDLSLDNPLAEASGVSVRDILMDIRYDAESQAVKEEIRERLFEVIDMLPVDQRTVILLTEFEGKSFREISRETDIPLGTLLARKSRAMARIKSIMTEYADLMED